ncbi:MAG: M20/M25/M40 family metallo-hydrolase [Thermoflexales bacterium]
MDLTQLLAHLVAINSVNPSLVAGAPGERPITDFVSGWLAGRNVDVAEVGPADRPSLLCRVPGTGGGRSLLLYAHTDTVGVAGMDAPFASVIRDGVLRGRGAYDMKASLAAILRVAASVAERPRAGDLYLMITADEESGSRGTEAVLGEIARRGLAIDACIVTEPSDLRLMLGHRGFATGTLTTRGRAAHTARRDEGVDAIAMMSRVIVGLEDLDARLNAGPGHPLLGRSAVLASRVVGGSELFTYPAECRAEFVWRTLPGQTRAGLTAEIEAIFAALKARDPRFDASLEWRLWREPMLIAADEPIINTLRAVAGQPAECAAPWWTDAALIQAAGIPAAIFGPAGGGIHSVDEWVDLDSLARFETILLNVTRRFCG